ncbi:glutathione S-transferase family protein [Aquisalinus flavus]|uniref:Glutathione S-transferase n=1 Tax=Aquisalinus flavus TaxID=1526572 RepID=A0A8J2Y5W7_9PROT|nr:glutathione S-transferase family protein [Aquisalinus flavus]MBD0427634.1 glutathione S-transferase family protein [Aquisalinus flavus]UNE47421.1 glutathione S-transferase family protein [Aquisalinus flavus]GGD02555.1 glutathione S-transferase [Aquisalinus flavus]
MSVIFYDFPSAPSPRRARIILREKAIDHEARVVDMMQNDQMGEQFRAINPDCTVPALQLEDGAVLNDNWGIALWAEAVAPEPALLGKTASEKGQVGSWAARIDFQGTISFAEAFRNSHRNFKNRALPGPENYDQIPELAERGFAKLAVFMSRLDEHLDGRDFIAIDSFSIADIWALTTIDACRWIKAGPTPENHPNIIRWHETVSARKSTHL